MTKITSLLAALVAVFCFGSVSFADLDNLDIGGDVKVMGVYTENTLDFDDDAGDQDDFIRLEAHLWFQADLADNVTAKVSIEVDRDFETEAEPGNWDDTRYALVPQSDDLYIHLEEAWIQMAYLYDSALSLKVGRQFIELGDGFFIGDANPYWPNNLTDYGEWEVSPFDAVLAWWDGDDWVLSLMWAKVEESRTFDKFAQRGDVDAYALYFSYKGWEDYELDIYAAMVNFDAVLPLFPGVQPALLPAGSGAFLGAEAFALGLRFAGSPYEGWNFKLEGVYEFGDIDGAVGANDMDIKAWAVEAGINYTWDSEYKPMVGLTYVYMSGDDDNTDGDWETYLPAFQNRTYGEIFDQWASFGNMHIFNLYGGFNLSEDVAISAKYYYFMADEDAVWSNDDSLGHEIDAFIDYQVTEELTAMFAAGLFITDNGVEDTYCDDDAWFVRAGVKVEF